MVRTKDAIVSFVGGLSPLMRLARLPRNPGSPIFMFHRVIPEGEACYDPEMATSPELFKAFLDWAKEHYDVLALEELVRLNGKSINGRKASCAITFDDGWRDNYLHAFPLLQQRRIPATVFLPVWFVGTTRHFWQERLWFCFEGLRQGDQAQSILRRLLTRFPWCPPLRIQEWNFATMRRILLDRPSQEADEFVDWFEAATEPASTQTNRAFLDWTEVRTMQAAGIAFGSHTLNHTLLTRSDPKTACEEIESSRDELESYLKKPAAGFSYPWGASDLRIRAQVKASGYAFAVTTATRPFRHTDDLFALPRLAVSNSFLQSRHHQFDPERMNFYLFRTAIRADKPKGTSAAKLSPPQKLRIAFVIDYIDAWEDGGTEKQLAKLIGSLDRQFFEPELHFLRPSRGLTEQDFPCPLRVASPGPGPKWSRTRVLFNLTRMFRRYRPQIVQTLFRDGTYYGTVAAWVARVPVIVISRRNAGYWKTATDRLALRFINRLADFWQCNSRAAYESLRLGESVPAGRIEILSNALDAERFLPATAEEKLSIRQSLNLPATGPVMVSVANLTPIKDPETLVEAAATVRQEFPDARFLLVGDGPLRSSLEARIAKEGLGEIVRLVGAQPDVRPYLAAADIALLTSRSEGSSNSLLEYMAMGLPAIVSDIPGNRELVEEEFFEPGDSSSLARKILQLWVHPDFRSRIGRGNRERIAQYDLEALARRAQSYYLKIAADRIPYGD